MPVQLASNITPKNGQTYYMLEDTYMKGSLQVRDDIADRDSIPLINLKVGSLVLCLDTDKIWKVTVLTYPTAENPDTEEHVEWVEFLTGDDAVETQPLARQVAIQTVSALAVDATSYFTLKLAAGAIIYKLQTSRPVQIQAYSTPARNDENPYTFISTSDHLTDDGSHKFADGTIVRLRNYSMFVNFENPLTNNIYFTATGIDDNSGPVTFTITYLPLEVVEDVETPIVEPTFYDLNISMYRGPQDPKYTLGDAREVYNADTYETIKSEYLAAGIRYGTIANEAAGLSTITMYEGLIDGFDDATIRSYLPLYFDLTDLSTQQYYQEALGMIDTVSAPEAVIALKSLIVYSMIASAPDMRSSLTMAERLKLQASIPSDSTLLSRSKIMITPPTPGLFPWSSMGTDTLGENNTMGTFVEYAPQNWKGAGAYGVSADLDVYNATATTDSLLVPPSNMLIPGTFSMPNVRPKKVLEQIDAPDWTKAMYEYYNSQGGPGNISTMLIERADENTFISPAGQKNFYLRNGELWIESDQSGGAINGETGRQIFAGEGGVPYHIIESRTYSMHRISDRTTDGAEWAWAPDGVAPSNWASGYATRENVYDNRFIGRNVDEYEATTGLAAQRTMWAWTQMIDVLSLEEWPDVVQVSLKKITTNEVVSVLTMKNAKDHIQINQAGDTAWFNNLRVVEFTEDHVHDQVPEYNMWDPDTNEKLPWPDVQLINQNKWAVDPWSGQPYKLLPEAGTNEYILEINRV